MSEESCWKASDDTHNLETSQWQISQYSLATSYRGTVRAFRGMIGHVVKKSTSNSSLYVMTAILLALESSAKFTLWSSSWLCNYKHGLVDMRCYLMSRSMRTCTITKAQANDGLYQVFHIQIKTLKQRVKMIREWCKWGTKMVQSR